MTLRSRALCALLALALIPGSAGISPAKGGGQHLNRGGGRQGGGSGLTPEQRDAQREQRREEKREARRESKKSQRNRRVKRIAAYLDNIRAKIMTQDEVLSKFRNRMVQFGELQPDAKLGSVRGIVQQAVAMAPQAYDTQRMQLAESIASILRSARKGGQVASAAGQPSLGQAPRGTVTRVDPDTGEELPEETTATASPAVPGQSPSPSAPATAPVTPTPAAPTPRAVPAEPQAPSRPPSGQVGERVEARSTVERVGTGSMRLPLKSTMPLLPTNKVERARVIALLQSGLRCKVTAQVRPLKGRFSAKPAAARAAAAPALQEPTAGPLAPTFPDATTARPLAPAPSQAPAARSLVPSSSQVPAAAPQVLPASPYPSRPGAQVPPAGSASQVRPAASVPPPGPPRGAAGPPPR